MAFLQKFMAFLLSILSLLGFIRNNETAFEKRYSYAVVNSAYAGYLPGKVIEPEKVGEPLEEAAVEAQWVYADGRVSDRETLYGTICAIRGIGTDTAVCIRFTEAGSVLTTTHWYVLINPSADTSAVAAYIIHDAPVQQEGPAEE